MDSISENLRRAQEAIARARALSTQLSSLCISSAAPTSDTAVITGASAASAESRELGPGAASACDGAGLSAADGSSPPPSAADSDPVQRYRAYLQQSSSSNGQPGEEGAGCSAPPSGSWHSSHQRLAALAAAGVGAAAAATDTCGLPARSAIPRHHSDVELDTHEPGGRAARGHLNSYDSRGGQGGDAATGVGALRRDGDGAGVYRRRCDNGGGGSDPGTSGGEGEGGGDLSSRLTHLAGPVLAVVTQLASLQRKQSETLQQLLVLRMQQLKLRQQQLTALQELLTAEMAAVEGTPLQVSAVEQAVGLLGQSLRDMKAASRAMLMSGPDQVAAVSAAVSATDSRADEVSRMARQLLGVLRAFPRRGGTAQDHDTVKGAAPAVIAAIPTLTCEAGSALLGQTCCICLGAFEEGDVLKGIQCVHYHHAACLDEWLSIRAVCPLCKAELPGS